MGYFHSQPPPRTFGDLKMMVAMLILRVVLATLLRRYAQHKFKIWTLRDLTSFEKRDLKCVDKFEIGI
jgi:hypothetical protein